MNLINSQLCRDVYLPLVRSSLYVCAGYICARKIYHSSAYLVSKAAEQALASHNSEPDENSWEAGARRKSEYHYKQFVQKIGPELAMCTILVLAGLAIERTESDLNLYIQDMESHRSIIANVSRGEFNKVYEQIREIFNFESNATHLEWSQNVQKTLRVAKNACQNFRLTQLASRSFFQRHGINYLGNISAPNIGDYLTVYQAQNVLNNVAKTGLEGLYSQIEFMTSHVQQNLENTTTLRLIKGFSKYILILNS